MPNNSHFITLKKKIINIRPIKVDYKWRGRQIDEDFWCAIARIWQWRHPAILAVCRLYPTYSYEKPWFSPTNNILFHGKNKGSLPLVMMFDLPDLIEIDDVEFQRIQEELDVGISIKPKQRQSIRRHKYSGRERQSAGRIGDSSNSTRQHVQIN